MASVAVAPPPPAARRALRGAHARLAAVSALVSASPHRYVAYARHPIDEAMRALVRIAEEAPSRPLRSDLPVTNLLALVREIRTDLEQALIEETRAAFAMDLVAALHGVGRAVTYLAVAIRMEADPS